MAGSFFFTRAPLQFTAQLSISLMWARDNIHVFMKVTNFILTQKK